jgi:hypothetical protein
MYMRLAFRHFNLMNRSWWSWWWAAKGMQGVIQRE